MRRSSSSSALGSWPADQPSQKTNGALRTKGPTVRRQRVHQSLIRPALILGMPQKPALFLLAVVGAQFTAGGIHPWSLAFLAFDLAVLYPLLASLAKSDVRVVDVFAE